jgi:hypothetical protein
MHTCMNDDDEGMVTKVDDELLMVDRGEAGEQQVFDFVAKLDRPVQNR